MYPDVELSHIKRNQMEEEFEVYKQAIKINLGDAKAHYGRGTHAFTYIFNFEE